MGNFAIIVALALAVLISSFFLFNKLLKRLSTSLIEPLNTLENQLASSQNPDQNFFVSQDSALEFQTLVNKLNEYTQKINDLVKREQAFARYTSHELRTPLTIIKGANSLLKKRLLEDVFAMRQINRVQNASNQISDMVDVMLGLVRYERNHPISPILQNKKISDILYSSTYLRFCN